MPITRDEVRHIAKLARLNLSDEEVEKFTSELGNILTYIEKLSSVNTETVEPTAQVTGTVNVQREDIVQVKKTLPDDLLAQSPLPKVLHQIETRSAHASS